MFSSFAKLKERTPANGVNREDFLAQLVDEFIHTKSQDAKEQVAANLANFAYDPINYEWMRDVGVLDIFLHILKTESSEKLIHFACAGICNACPEFSFKPTNPHKSKMAPSFRLLAALCVASLLTRWPLPVSSAVLAVDQTTALAPHKNNTIIESDEEILESCVCGVFMSGDVRRARVARGGRARRGRPTPSGEPVLEYDTDDVCLPCGPAGYKHCINKCLDELVKHLPKAGGLVCSAVGRDCARERAHLFVRNCDTTWVSTHFAAGTQFCCSGGVQVGC